MKLLVAVTWVRVKNSYPTWVALVNGNNDVTSSPFPGGD